MKRTLLPVFLAIGIISAVSCTQNQQTKADEQAQAAKQDVQKAAEDVKDKAKDLANDVKDGADKLKEKAHETAQNSKPDTEQASDKMHDAASQAVDKTKELGQKASNATAEAALTTKVKTALANDLGLKSLTNVSVESKGSTVTLTGQAASAADKKRAAQTAMAVSGVAHVVNKIQVQPASGS
jgi:hyperosmotically inducible periplasmic protein